MISEIEKSVLRVARKFWVTAAALLLLVGLPEIARAQQELNVYSALDEDHFAEIMAAFEAKYPDIKTNKIIDSNGPIIARLLAEKDNPQADILLGAAASGLLVLHKAGVLEGYKPADFDKIKPKLRDQQNDPPMWVGMDAWASAICFNSAEGSAQNVDQPATWNDLLKPEYQGKITMPNPNSSGTGFLTVAGWLNLFGEEDGWDYMDKLHVNISQYIHSGGAPCRMAATGETLVGISYAFPGVKAINDGAPLAVILPDEGIGAEIEAVALIKGGKNPEAAKLLADFAASEEGNIISNNYYVVVGREGVSNPIPNYPEGEEQKMLDMDFVWLADNRQRILDECEKRYGIKDAPQD